MTIASTTTKNSYSGNGSTTAFNYTFFIPTNTDIEVIIRSSTGTETVKSEGTGSANYSISGVGSSSGGAVTFVTAPISTETVVLRRNTAKTQATDYVANDPFPAESHESALDKLTIISQDLQEQVDRSLKISRTNTMTSTDFTTSATDRASKVLAFDSSGELSVTQELGTFKGNWAASTTYEQRDIVKDTSTNNIFIVNTGHTSSGSQPLTSNANSAKYDLLVDASSATTSATNAASSATAAANSATTSTTKASEASTSASNASTSESNASTSASTASTQATNASNSATAAASSATSAATSLDTFDDRFLGAKSSDPSTDNDGDALITGALYFNSSNNVLMVYTGSAWVRTTPTSSDQTNINALSASAVITDMALLGTADVIADMALLADADVIADMNTLATSDIVSDLNTLATSDIVSDLNTLATSDIVSDINVLATSDVVSDLNTLATSDIVSDLNTLATSDIVSDINTLATSDIVSDLNTLATSDIVTDLNILATSDNVTNMATLGASGVVTNIASVAGSISNVNTAATNLTGINSFAERYRVGSSDPSSSNDEGDLFYNTTDNTFKFFNGSSYVAVNVAGIDNIVEDTTPQLGGNLDVNGNDIVTTSNADIELAPNGTGKTVLKGNTNPGTLIFNCENNSHGQTVKAQNHASGVTNVLTLPPGSDQEIVGTSATQTLTNKTIDASQLSGSIAEARLPAAALGSVWESKSANFTAEARKNYFIDTSGGAVTATLPSSGTLGDEIHFVDAVGTFDTNNLTVGRNSHKIQGATSDLTVNTERAGFTLVYYNAAQGWLLKDV